MYKTTGYLIVCVLMTACKILTAVPLNQENQAVHLKFSLADQSYTVTVSGRVSDRNTGEPISNALVKGFLTLGLYMGPDHFDRCPLAVAHTDNEGRYELQFNTPLTTTGLREGKDSLCVIASAPGYETLPQYVRPYVTPEKTEYSDVDFELGPGQLIQGIVVDENNIPIEGARIRHHDGLNGDMNFFGATGETFTDENGLFNLWITPGRGRWLTIYKQKIGTIFVWDYLNKQDLGMLVLPKLGTITGRVIDSEGNGVPGCEVMARGWPVEVIDRVLTDTQGYYELKGIPGEPGIVDFYTKKNTIYMDNGKCKVYARLNPEIQLQNASQYEIMAQDGETIVGPDLVVGIQGSVSGKVVGSADNPFGLGGLTIQLDGWSNMATADFAGRFVFPNVRPGKHKLRAFLPANSGYNYGIGHCDIDLAPGQALDNVEIKILTLTEARIQFIDADGNPLAGITATASFSNISDTIDIVGSVSNNDGRAIIYLHPDKPHYLGGYDYEAGKTFTESYVAVTPRAGQIIDNIQIYMVPTSTFIGRLLDADRQLVTEEYFTGYLTYADGVQKRCQLGTDAQGYFRTSWLPPGIVVKMSLDNRELLCHDVLGAPIEAKPGIENDLGDVILENSIDKKEFINRKHADIWEHPEEITQAAQQLFEKIRDADYDYFLNFKNTQVWQEFPTIGYYMANMGHNELVEWICTTFKDNPIVKIELGTVFPYPEAIIDQTGLPAIPYKLTLNDGTLLEGILPFEFNFDGGIPHWHGLEGIDWHLKR